MRPTIASFASALFILSTLIVTPASAMTLAHCTSGDPSPECNDDYGIAAAGTYCPTLSITMQRGARDVSTNNQVSELQKFLADYYNFDPNELVSGYFGRITQGYVIQFQKEQGLPSVGIAGQLTRGKIATVCSQTPTTQSSHTNTTSGAVTPSINTFAATPGTITAGHTVTLSWTSSLATQCSVLRNESNGGYTAVAQNAGTNSTYTVNPNTSSAYTLNCLGTADGSGKDAPGAQRTVFVSVSNQSSAITPSINTFSASLAQVMAGQAVTLSWTSSLAQNCHVLRHETNGGYTSIATNAGANGTYTVYPQVSSAYSLQCYGTADGSGKDAPGTEKTAFVSVTPYQSSAITPYINSFTSSVTQVVAGQPVTLSWGTSQATKCGILRDSNTWVVMDQGTSGSYVVNPTVSTTYTLSCAGTADGSGKDAPGAERTLFITVTPYQSAAITPYINSFSASPSQVKSGGAVTLTWGTSQATKCGILKDVYNWVVMDQSTSGSYTVNPTTSTTYTLSCAGTADGSGKDAPGAQANAFVSVTQ